MDKPIQLKVPLMGYLVPLEKIPDPVFAQKLMGDGVSIDPMGQVLVAPLAGEVVQLHPAHHALTIRGADGLEVLMHIGIDTVQLKGRGFTPKVKTGEQVKEGQPLIEFDADYIATHAKSLLTQIIIVEPKTGLSVKTIGSGKKNTDDVLLEITRDGASKGAAPSIAHTEAGSTLAARDQVEIINPTGIHARPAALIINATRDFYADIRLKNGERTVDARSIVGVLSLEAACGDKVEIIATGRDAELAVSTVKKILQQKFDDESEHQAKPAPMAAKQQEDDDNQIHGVAASQGAAFGKIYQYRMENIHFEMQGSGYQAESKKLLEALEQARQEIKAIRSSIEAKGDARKAAIFTAHLELLDDPVLVTEADEEMKAGHSASHSWQKAYSHQVDQLMNVNNELIKARANDLRDVGRRVLQALTGQAPTKQDIPSGSIVIAEDLTPSDIANFDLDQVLGFCTVAGGSTSHVAILARSLGIPAVTGVSEQALNLPQGSSAIVDGTKGVLLLHPSAAQIDMINKRMAKERQWDQDNLAHAHEKAKTVDGRAINVYANIGGLEDAKQAVKLGGEGVGLLRSEFLFLNTQQAPSVAEQRRIYEDIAKTLGPNRSLVIRTLDIGGDKPVSYLSFPAETNPFLGMRGARLSFEVPDLFREQIRAILEAAGSGNIKIMFPMVTFIEEVVRLKKMVEEECSALGIAKVPVGIMVEVPSVAVLADQFAEEVDFFSIGTNDLTQYVLAMDRTHPKLARQVDGLDPAVLHLIANTAKAAAARQKSVSICGGLASDRLAVPILLGLGIKELSVSIPSIPNIKADIRRYHFDQCRELAEKALKAKSAVEVRQLAQDLIDSIHGTAVS